MSVPPGAFRPQPVCKLATDARMLSGAEEGELEPKKGTLVESREE